MRCLLEIKQRHTPAHAGTAKLLCFLLRVQQQGRGRGETRLAVHMMPGRVAIANNAQRNPCFCTCIHQPYVVCLQRVQQ